MYIGANGDREVDPEGRPGEEHRIRHRVEDATASRLRVEECKPAVRLVHRSHRDHPVARDPVVAGEPPHHGGVIRHAMNKAQGPRFAPDTERSEDAVAAGAPFEPCGVTAEYERKGEGSGRQANVEQLEVPGVALREVDGSPSLRGPWRETGAHEHRGIARRVLPHPVSLEQWLVGEEDGVCAKAFTATSAAVRNGNRVRWYPFM
jgi:hypothetical protein